MSNPTVRALIRDALAGLGAFLASYQAGEEWLPALIAGLAVFVAFGRRRVRHAAQPVRGRRRRGGKVKITFERICLAAITAALLGMLLFGLDVL